MPNPPSPCVSLSTPNVTILTTGNENVKFRAGGLRFCLETWRQLTSDPVILDLVEHAHLKFVDGTTPKRNKGLQPYPMSKIQKQVMALEITKLMDEGVIYEFREDEAFLSNVFLRTKKDGSNRLILNLKELNTNIEYQKFKMETLESIVKLMRPNCFMASLDLKSAYFSVFVAPEHHKYLSFPWGSEEGGRKVYAFCCLPNGLASAPRDFTKLLKPPLAYLRLLGVTIAIYIDDTYIQGSSLEECSKNVRLASTLLEKLGFVINIKKSVFKPAQQLVMLGFSLDSVLMAVRPTSEKADKIKALCSSLIEQHSCTIRFLAKTIGTLVAVLPGAQFGPLHYRALECLKIAALKLNKGSFEASVTLSVEAEEELAWWVANVNKVERRIHHGNPQLSLETDASKLGWGAVFQGVTTGGRWSCVEAEQHINVLELQAAFFGLKSLCSNVSGKHIRLNVDNTTAVCYINALGGVRSPACNEVTKAMWQWAICRNVWLSAAHLAGSLNIKADKASRQFNDRTEWKLNERVFEDICKKLDKPNIDLFATRLNAQLPDYVAWQPDPEAKHIDAFTINWEKTYNYLFPPFSLLNGCVQKITQDQAIGIVIAPIWPTQVWFTPLMQLLTRVPLVLPKNCLKLPVNSNTTLPKNIRLMACRVSGKISDSKVFLKELPTLSCPVGDSQPRNSTCMSLINGGPIAVLGKYLTLQHLYQ